MTTDQERDLTERIIRWAGMRAESHSAADEITHWWYIGGLAVAYEYGDGSFHVLNVFCLLDSRDDWALVEDEIERRGLMEKYLCNLFIPIFRENGWKLMDAYKLARRASPLVCAQAWDEMMKEVGG